MQMKTKLYIVVIVALLAASAAQAQFKLGVRAGVSMTNLSEDDVVNNLWKPGFQVGIVGNYALSDAFSIQPGLLFVTQGRKMDYTGETEGAVYSVTENISLNYLQLPVDAQYKFYLGKLKLLLQAVPYLGYGLGGKRKLDNTLNGVLTSTDEKIKMGSDKFELGMNLKSFDFGLGGGIGLKFSNIQIGLKYNLGLMNLNSMTEKKHRDFYISQGGTLAQYEELVRLNPKDIEWILKHKIKNHGLILSFTFLFGK